MIGLSLKKKQQHNELVGTVSIWLRSTSPLQLFDNDDKVCMRMILITRAFCND